MIQLRWIDQCLQFRERSFQVDAAGAFCGVTEFNDWTPVPQAIPMGAIYEAAVNVLLQVDQHGGPFPHYPELHKSIDELREAMISQAKPA